MLERPADISVDIVEPDLLYFYFKVANMIIDAKTSERFLDDKVYKIELMPQKTEEDIESILEMKQAAAVVGGTIVIWQIIMLFLLQKVIFSLWHLINMLQFFVYIALWQINYPRLTSVILMELR